MGAYDFWLLHHKKDFNEIIWGLIVWSHEHGTSAPIQPSHPIYIKLHRYVTAYFSITVRYKIKFSMKWKWTHSHGIFLLCDIIEQPTSGTVKEEQNDETERTIAMVVGSSYETSWYTDKGYIKRSNVLKIFLCDKIFLSNVFLKLTRSQVFRERLY